ncbi:sigma-70 family RNA polymerase sigma factor [Actinoplanes sp. RD1]|uniref:sigma-70 family RNA polymerase sigma factor n=1 Tax=Actinoplanes sp. RD1 TaxID=3064538 RepID=UPI0027426EFD|nr:sigma-70 family RNA polymerase sigma factor [Actinoplanes sp. RD1]
MPPEDDLHALAAAAAGGDRAAFTALVRATQRDVMRFLGSLAHRRDVEDLTQETFLRAFRALPGFAGRSTVRTWLFAIAKRVAADAVRQASSRPRLVTLGDWHGVAERGTIRFEEEHALRDLLGGLTAERREAFVLTQVAGLSYAEAAEICGCPVGTIRSRVARARDDLAAALASSRSAV